MHPEKWRNILEHVKDNFSVEEYENYHLDEEGGKDIEHIIFKSPLGRVKLEYISRPVVLDKKTSYTRRIGSETKVDYVYSEDEKSHKMIAYKWDGARDDWTEINAKAFE